MDGVAEDGFGIAVRSFVRERAIAWFVVSPHDQTLLEAPADADDSLGFVRGLAYGLACVVPFWGLVIASAWLVF